MGSVFSRLRITAVEKVSLSVHRGEIFGLAGESGRGKSTLAKMILGFEQPSEGEIIHRGRSGESITGKNAW